MLVLAIETSCDETGIGIVRLSDDGSVSLLADEVASSVDEHTRFGGVVPEVASRAHLERWCRPCAAHCGQRELSVPMWWPRRSGRAWPALLVGVASAKAYAAAWGVPFYGVNHLGGHLAADVFDHGPLPECVGLLVSGGHTNLLRPLAGRADGRTRQHGR